LRENRFAVNRRRVFQQNRAESEAAKATVVFRSAPKAVSHGPDPQLPSSTLSRPGWQLAILLTVSVFAPIVSSSQIEGWYGASLCSDR
jgi:hypothetical protein